MRRRDWMIVGVALIGVIAVWSLVPRPRVHFDDIDEAWDGIKRVRIIRAPPTCAMAIFKNGFMISKDEATWVQAGDLYKAGPMGPEWKNKVWVMPLSRSETKVYVIPDDAGTRVWGRVFVYGDSAFLNEIEAGLSKQRDSCDPQGKCTQVSFLPIFDSEARTGQEAPRAKLTSKRR